MNNVKKKQTAAWPLVMRREILVKLTDKAFLLGTIVTVVIIAGLLGFQAWQAEQTKDYRLIATPDSVAMAKAVAEAAPELDDKVTVKIVTVDDQDAAEATLEDEKADAWLHEDTEGWRLTTESKSEDDLKNVVDQVVRARVIDERATEAGTTIEALQKGTDVRADFLRGDAERAELADAISFAFAFLFYIAALIFGMQLANSVVEEKQSRIVEIIAASIPVRHLLAGKVLGNTVLALLQVLIYAGVGLVGLAFTPYADLVPSVSGPVIWFIGFFVAGFIALACLWAVAGSLASRTEDLQATATPLTMLVMAVFFSGLFLEGKAQVIASYVPPVSAVVMPKRILAGGVDWWEPLLALGLLGGFAAITVLLGERVYRRALLQTQGRVSLRQAWSASE